MECPEYCELCGSRPCFQLLYHAERRHECFACVIKRFEIEDQEWTTVERAAYTGLSIEEIQRLRQDKE
jgi:hypothetical protein